MLEDMTMGSISEWMKLQESLGLSFNMYEHKGDRKNVQVIVA